MKWYIGCSCIKIDISGLVELLAMHHFTFHSLLSGAERGSTLKESQTPGNRGWKPFRSSGTKFSPRDWPQPIVAKTIVLSLGTQLPVHKNKRLDHLSMLLSSKVSQGDRFFLLFVHCVSGIYELRVTNLIFIFKHDLWTLPSQWQQYCHTTKKEQKGLLWNFPRFSRTQTYILVEMCLNLTVKVTK